MNGKPLRFLAMVLGGWTAARAVLLWPDATAIQRAIAPRLAASPSIDLPPFLMPPPHAPAPPMRLWVKTVMFAPPTMGPLMKPAAPILPVGRRGPHGRSDPDQVALALAAMVPYGAEQVDPDPAIPPPLAPTPRAVGARRWAGSAWAIARGGRNDALAGGQLGGSQAGARLTYALDAGGAFALAARASAPLEGRGKEAALGLEWRPVAGAPIRLLAERRFAIDGGRGGGAVLAVAGLPPTRVAGLTAEAYGQAGAVEHRGAFADGAARLTRRIGAERLRLDLGVGSWGGAQRAAARLDIGPTLGLGVPIEGRRIRLTLDYRLRIAGQARPGSGLALSIGSDF